MHRQDAGRKSCSPGRHGFLTRSEQNIQNELQKARKLSTNILNLCNYFEENEIIVL